MFASKPMSLWCWATEPELKQGLFFEIEVSGALTRGSDIILNQICPKKNPDSKLKSCTADRSLSLFQDTTSCSLHSKWCQK